MDLAFVLHLYQPSTQDEAVFKKIAAECYLPLIKLIKNKRDFNLTLNIPLSLLDQMDKYGYKAWIEDIKELVNTEKVEITGSGAYHPLLSKFDRTIAEQQIMLNEFGLGYYFGRKNGFEGESAILIKDISGFFPPELAINNNLVKVLDDFGYKWVLVDETVLMGSHIDELSKTGVYRVDGTNLHLVIRDRFISNILSFKRDLNYQNVMDLINNSEKDALVIAMDAEYFGHHFKEGILLLDTMLERFKERGIRLVRAVDIVDSGEESVIYDIAESSWGASDEEMTAGNVYPLWSDPMNEIHMLQWEIVQAVEHVYVKQVEKLRTVKIEDGFETFPIWKTGELSKLNNPEVIKYVQMLITANKSFQSDQFWWASKKVMPTGEVLYDRDMILKGLSLIENTIDLLDDSKLKETFYEKKSKIVSILDKSEVKLF